MEFKKGNYYLTEDRDRMVYILSVCDCSGCEDRGFYEPYAVRYRLGELPIEDYITIYEKDALLKQINKTTSDRKDLEVQMFFNNARTVALTEVNEMIKQ